MTVHIKTGDRFARLAEICLALPAATREDVGSHSSFRVAKKVFAYYLNDHHGDGIVDLCCKVLPDENQRMVKGNPRKFYMPAYLSSRGWVAVRLDRPTVDWNEVKEMVLGSYVQMAPQRYRKLVSPSSTP